MKSIVNEIRRMIKSSSMYFALVLIINSLWCLSRDCKEIEVSFVLGVYAFIFGCHCVDLMISNMNFHSNIIYHLFSIVVYYGFLILVGYFSNWFPLDFAHILYVFAIFLVTYLLGSRYVQSVENKKIKEMNELITKRNNEMNK